MKKNNLEVTDQQILEYYSRGWQCGELEGNPREFKNTTLDSAYHNGWAGFQMSTNNELDFEYPEKEEIIKEAREDGEIIINAIKLESKVQPVN